MLCARGERCLMVDADGATRFADLEKLEEALDKITTRDEGHGIAVGSRSHLVTTEAVVKVGLEKNESKRPLVCGTDRYLFFSVRLSATS